MIPNAVRVGAEASLEARTGRSIRIQSSSPAGGGCINPSAAVRTEDGELFFLKWNDSAPAEMFAAEADGLEALSLPRSLRVPEVVGWGGGGTGNDPGWLLMEYISPGAPGSDFGASLGAGLAQLHAAPSESSFGWHRNNYIGSLHQENRLGVAWAPFWRDRRILPQFILARDRGYFGGASGAILDRLVEGMEELLPQGTVRPALLHGDLWSGNYYPDGEGSPVLIDPAVYRGDGEVDLAMMQLFGSFPRGFEEAYREGRGTSTEDQGCRWALYQLYYLLVHVNLFGGSYVGGTLRAAREALGGG